LFSGVIRRIDIDHLDLAEVRLLQKLQDFQVVTLDEHVLRLIEVHGFLANRLQRPDARLLNNPHAFRLTRPVEFKALFTRINPITEYALELIEVNRAFSQDLRECLTETS